MKGFFWEQAEDDDEDYTTLRVTTEEYERWRAPWRKSLIMKLLGKSIPLWLMKQNLTRMWKTKHTYSIRDLDNSFFFASFKGDDG